MRAMLFTYLMLNVLFMSLIALQSSLIYLYNCTVHNLCGVISFIRRITYVNSADLFVVHEM